MAGNPKCKKLRHPLHICALREGGLHDGNCKELAELAHDPQFRCETCGAVAKRAENLCNPKRI